MLELVVGRRSEDLVHLEEVSQMLLVHGLVDHDVAGLVVGVAVLDHVRAHVDTRVAVDPKVVDEQEHEALVVEEVLEALEGELVQIVVDADDLHLDECVVLQKFEHELRVDQTSQVEDEVGHGELQSLDLLSKRALDVTFEHFRKVARFQFLDPFHLHLVEVLRVVLPQVSHQVLVNHFIPDARRLQLAQLELDRVLVQDSLGCLLHADGADVEDVWRAHVVNDVVRAQRLQLLLLGLQLLGEGGGLALLGGQLADGSGRGNLRGRLGSRHHTHLNRSELRLLRRLLDLNLLLLLLQFLIQCVLKQDIARLLIAYVRHCWLVDWGQLGLMSLELQLALELLLLRHGEGLLLLLGQDALQALDLVRDADDESDLRVHVSRLLLRLKQVQCRLLLQAERGTYGLLLHCLL